jgi:hypothetical protein
MLLRSLITPYHFVIGCSSFLPGITQMIYTRATPCCKVWDRVVPQDKRRRPRSEIIQGLAFFYPSRPNLIPEVDRCRSTQSGPIISWAIVFSTLSIDEGSLQMRLQTKAEMIESY